jgi:hypothetical protein
MARRKAKSSSVKVNFKGVESRQTPAEGDYPFKVLEAVSGVSSNKNDQIEVTAEIYKGEYKGYKGYIYFPLQENSLWKLHAFLTALGEEVPEDEMDIDLSELVDKEFVGVLTHETYNGRKRAKLTDFDSIDNYSGGDDDEKGGKGKKGAGKKSKSKKVSRSDVEEMDEDELQELLEEHDLEDEVDLDDHKKLPKKIAAVIEALEEADLLDDGDGDDDEDDKKSSKSKKSGKGKKSKDDDDDEDEDDKKSSKKSGKGGKKKPKKIDRDDVEDMDEDDLQELIDEHDLDVDLDDHKKIGKKREAVIDALEDEDLLEDE